MRLPKREKGCKKEYSADAQWCKMSLSGAPCRRQTGARLTVAKITGKSYIHPTYLCLVTGLNPEREEGV